MRKQSVLGTLAAVQVVAEVLFFLYWRVMRIGLGYRLDASRFLPIATRIAISDWFAPLVALTGALPVVLAFFPLWRTRTSTYLAGAGVVFTVFGLAFAIFAAYEPAFAELGR
jgi:hypothetical protein